jgi:hypothetical protein
MSSGILYHIILWHVSKPTPQKPVDTRFLTGFIGSSFNTPP